MSMYVVKRNGRRESVHFDKITSRVSKLCYGLNSQVRTCTWVLGYANDQYMYIQSTCECIAVLPKPFLIIRISIFYFSTLIQWLFHKKSFKVSTLVLRPPN